MTPASPNDVAMPCQRHKILAGGKGFSGTLLTCTPAAAAGIAA